ncbi:MAG: glycosyltransferase [Candidatus Lokiarchaeia archaeon]
MKISIYGQYYFPYITDLLKEEGHVVLLNEFSNDIDVCVLENRFYMYEIYRKLKIIRKNNIKLINSVLDIPPWLIDKKHQLNTHIKYIKQVLYNSFHKHPFWYYYTEKFRFDPARNKYYNIFTSIFQNYFNRIQRNRVFFQKNYRKFLKNSTLNLSLSKYTQFLVKKFLKLPTKVCYPCVNSDYLLNLPKKKIVYDAINISRIETYKRQKIFIEAAKRLNLNIMVVGRHVNKKIKLFCPHYYFENQEKVFDILNQSNIYVDPSEFEGFGMTPIEAAFLDKITIASNTYVHREVLGDYALYFELNNVDNLVNKMETALGGGFKLKNESIKKKYSKEALKNRLLRLIEELF